MELKFEGMVAVGDISHSFNRTKWNWNSTLMAFREFLSILLIVLNGIEMDSMNIALPDSAAF